jgi:hypothetical protein
MSQKLSSCTECVHTGVNIKNMLDRPQKLRRGHIYLVHCIRSGGFVRGQLSMNSIRPNLCSMLVDLKQDLAKGLHDTTVTKADMCDTVNTRICELVKQIISTPYCNNFCFDIDKPPELDEFDRVALQAMETSDDLSTVVEP